VLLQHPTLYAYILQGSTMTSIKPPSSAPSGSQPLTDAANPGGGVDAADSGGVSFNSVLSGTGGAQQAHEAAATAAAGQVAAQSGVDSAASLALDIEAGRISMDQAVERLLEQTVASLGTQLSLAQRNELSGLLRSALASDPTLLALRGEDGG
jgi:hypothetical protein